MCLEIAANPNWAKNEDWNKSCFLHNSKPTGYKTHILLIFYSIYMVNP